MKARNIALFFLPLLVMSNLACSAQQAAGVRICVSESAEPALKEAVKTVIESAQSNPLLDAMGAFQDGALQQTTSEALLAGPVEQRAYNHLIVIGLPDDPLVSSCLQKEAKFDKDAAYIFGFGNFKGDVGYIESDRNAFLHSSAIAKQPFETETVIITGTSSQAVLAAVKAFCTMHLVNAVVKGATFARTTPTLLDRDPVLPVLPAWVPAKIGSAPLVAVTQCGENEYRDTLAAAGQTPRQIWRLKYHDAADWSGAGSSASFAQYSNGLHRRAYGQTLWLAEFQSAAEADRAAKLIAKSAALVQSGAEWLGKQPPFAWETNAAGPLTLRVTDNWVTMSTINETR